MNRYFKKILLFVLIVLPLAIILSACGGGATSVSDDSPQNEEQNTFVNISFASQTLDYDGQEHELLIAGTLPEGANILYQNNVATNAGRYNATATISLEGYETLILHAELTINKIDYDMTNAHWEYNTQNEYVYNGSAQSVEVVGLPQGVTVNRYTNNTATNAGLYTASVELSYDTTNYNAPSLPNLSWRINKADYDMTNAHWGYDAQDEYVYNGSAQSVEVVGLPQGVTINRYTNNTATNAGLYTASVELSYDTTNYNAPSLPTLSWRINKATYDMSNVHWEYSSSFVYDGVEKTICVVGLPQGVTITAYQNNSKTAVGTYTASVIIDYDRTNYNEISISDCVWKIIPDLSDLAADIVNSFLKVPDVWEFLPESFSLENKVYNGNTEIDFTDFVSVSSLPRVAFGKQMNVVYSTLLEMDSTLGYLRYVYGSANAIIGFYQTFINSNPDNYATYEKTTDNFTFKIVLDDSNYQMYISYSSAAIELSYELATQKCYGRIELSNANVFKYEMSQDELTLAVKLLGLSLTEMHFERANNVVSGYVYEYTGTENHNIKTSALIKIDQNYTSIISNKRETDDLAIEGYLEVYSNTTGNLVGCEVKETVSSVKYDTCWFNLWDVSNINTIKVIDETNGTNADTIYINGSDNPIKTKPVGGFSGRFASRRFDIEMKDLYLYIYNQGNERYEKVAISLPMLFVQNDFIDSFSSDFYDKNESTGAINPTTITMNASDSSYMFAEYSSLIDEYLVIKENVTYASIVEYIGDKNEYFE